jgi:hypothetical protein
MMTQHQLYDFIYEKLKENLEENELSIIHPEKEIMFEIDDQNVRLYINNEDEEADIDLIWQIGIQRYRDVTDEPPEAEVKFKEEFIEHMKEVEDHFKKIDQLDFLNDGLNEFLMMTF